MESGLLPCRYHPERPGIGICPSCRTTVCEECSTRVDGILRCRACLSAAARTASRSRWRDLSAIGPALLLAPMAWGSLGLFLYGIATTVTLCARLRAWVDRILLEGI